MNSFASGLSISVPQASLPRNLRGHPADHAATSETAFSRMLKKSANVVLASLTAILSILSGYLVFSHTSRFVMA